MTPPAIPNVTQYIDIVLLAVTLLCAWPAYKRGILREGLIAVCYVPYIAMLFYIVNEFIQDSYTFDSMILKMSACGGFYLTCLFAIYVIGKVIDKRYKHHIPAELHMAGNVSAFAISCFRTLYFVVLCLMLFIMHSNDSTLLKDSKILTGLTPTAENSLNFLIDNEYISNEVVVYNEDYEYEHPKEKLGIKMNPIVKRIMQSKKYKEYQESGMEEKVKEQMLDYINKNGGLRR